jgi:hypothetical protein
VAGDEAIVAAPARTGSSSSSSSDEEKKAKKAKAKSRSASRKRASIFGGLLGKKDKAEEKEEKTDGEVVKEETPVVAPVAETSTTAPVITSDIPETSHELKTETAPVAVVPATTEELKTEESAVKPVDEKPKPTKRGSVFGSFFEKIKSPTQEKKEVDLVPAPIAKDAESSQEASKPLEEAQVAVPTTIEPVSEPTGVKTDEVKAADNKPAVSTPSKEKEHFSFGKLFGSKDRSKSPAATDKVAEPTKIDAVAPQIEETPAAATSEPVEPVVVAPVTETKVEPVVADKKDEKKEKRGSIFGSLGRSLSKATKSKDSKDVKKETATPTTVHEATEPKEEATIAPTETKDATPAPVEQQTIGDVVPGAVTVGDMKSSSAVTSTA